MKQSFVVLGLAWRSTAKYNQLHTVETKYYWVFVRKSNQWHERIELWPLGSINELRDRRRVLTHIFGCCLHLTQSKKTVQWTTADKHGKYCAEPGGTQQTRTNQPYVRRLRQPFFLAFLGPREKFEVMILEWNLPIIKHIPANITHTRSGIYIEYLFIPS